MHTIYFDKRISDEARRQQLYGGQLFVYSATPGSEKLVELARELIAQAFGPLDPETAQYHLPVERYAAILSDLKPKFIHHPSSKKFIQEILAGLGCDLDKTYFDVPRMRTAMSDNYLVAYEPGPRALAARLNHPQSS